MFILNQFMIMKTPNGSPLFSLSMSKVAVVSVFTWIELTFSAVLFPEEESHYENKGPEFAMLFEQE